MSSQGRYPFISAGSAVIKIENVIFNRVGAACEKTLPVEQAGISAHSYPLAILMYFRRSGVSYTQARGQTFSKSFASHFRFRQLAPALSLAFCRRKHKKCKKSTARASRSIVKKIKLDLKASLRDRERCEAAVCNWQARFCFSLRADDN